MAKSKATSTSMEKTIGLVYVLLIFLITTGICAYILFVRNSDYRFANGKKDAMYKVERVKAFQEAQAEYFDKIVAMEDYANQINPNVNASYQKNELKYIIGSVKKITADNKYDTRFRIFEQVADFYELKLFDREFLGVTVKNIDNLKVELDKCRGSVENLNNN